MDEFSFIEKYLSPLTFGRAEALDLKDDAAIIPHKPGHELIITKDAIVEGTHFFKNDSAANIAQKLLRVNLSDLAAKGATPYCCFLALVLPKNTAEKWLQEFSEGLKTDLAAFGLFLAGGDTTSHDGGLILSLTMLGYVPQGKAILRKGARDGDLVFVTGTIGDSFLGLEILHGNYQQLEKTDQEFAINRYHIPQPRLNIAEKLQNIATACADISDGLLADLGHICECSDVAAEIMLGSIPLSKAAINASKATQDFPLKAVTAGDDYELIFTAPASEEAKIQEISKNTGIKISKIGQVSKGKGLRLLDKNNQEIKVGKVGYVHE